MDMNSFFGGPPGQSFAIKATFRSRYGTAANGITDSMEADLAQGWTSPISIGEFVAISYGLPNDDNYEIYKLRDINIDGKTYNSTLWQKIYRELDGTANGISYKLISSMTGNTPHIIIDTPSEVLNADEEPDVIFDGSNIDSPHIKFKLPQSQVLSVMQPTKVLNVDENPMVVYDETNINRPVLQFSLPQSQRITKAELEEQLAAGETPQVRLDISDSLNEPVLKFKLPVSQEFKPENVHNEVLDADQDPYITFDTTDIDHPVLTFYLPQSQVMQDPETEVLDPADMPNVISGGTVNEPQLTFKLPRAVAFYYGSLLGEKSAGNYVLDNPAFDTYGIGDYYINAATGFIYKVIEKTGTECTFQYVASIQAPLPDVCATEISPYDDSGNSVAPTAEKRYTNAEETEWEILFKLPKAPQLEASYDFVGSVETGTVSATTSDHDTVNFHFTIPTGSNIFAGTDDLTTATIDKSKPGDLYLDTNTGFVYKLNINREWVKQDDGLKGPPGNALNIVRDYTIIETTTVQDSLANGVDYIIQHYVDSEGNPLPLDSSQLFAVTWQGLTTDEETSYWYFYAENGEWGRVQLTSGITNLFKNIYDNEQTGPTISQGYSVNYINKLIGGELKNDETDNLTTYSKEQIVDMFTWGEF